MSQNRVDPVTLEVIRNALPAICNEMSAVLQRTSYNMMIYEVRDYCCALLDKDGNLLSQNVGGVSHFVADLGVLVKDGVGKYRTKGFKEGDVVVTNHQAVAGQHLNNMVVYTPFLWKGELLAFSMVRAHWIDVGGMSTGFGAGPRVLDPWMEGLQIDQLKVYDEGTPNETLLKIIRDNVRYPDSSLGDLRAQIAACKLATRRLSELHQRYGKETIHDAVKTIFAESEAKCRNVVKKIPNGVYEAESYFDNDMHDLDKQVRIHARVEVKDGEMTIDLSGCSQQRPGAINSRTYAAARVAYKALTTPTEPVNEGSFGALKVIIPEGNVMMAKYPAPMSSWSAIIPSVVDTILKALATAVPNQVPAAHLGTLGSAIVFFGTNPATGKNFLVQSIEGGGWGGRPTEDGESASVSVCQGDVRNAPIEGLELKCPVLIEERKFRTDSGGAGRFRGGLGLDVRVRNLVEGRWNLRRTGRHKNPPWGLWKGKPGSPEEYLLKTPGQESWESVDVTLHPVPTDSQAIIRSAGGGGWGSPLERDPKLVALDVKEGFVSKESARADYGVVVEGDFTVDFEATEKLRKSASARRR